jgi:hypothetical protein
VATKEQVKACRDALAIIDPGACNGCGVSHSLTDAYKAWLYVDGTSKANQSSPVKLMLHQLCCLARITEPLSMEEYTACIEDCKAIIESNKVIPAAV